MNKQLLLPIINQFLAWKHKVPRQNIGYERAKNIGILYSLPDRVKSAAILALIAEIKSDNKTTSPICLLDPKSFNHTKSNECFGQHQIKLFGGWDNPIVPKFCERKFDYILHLDKSVSPLIENILLKSSALCRIGYYNEEKKHLFEMMIKTDEDTGLSFQMMEIYRYLKQLR